jgi:tetratricopeptide (TPR) repeat protein
MMKFRVPAWLGAAAGMVVLTLALGADAAPPDQDSDAQAPPAPQEPNAPAQPQASQPADDEDQRLRVILEQLTPEELEALVKSAMTLIRTEERKLVAAELRSGLLYDPADVQAAVEGLEKDVRDTQQDNVDRICRAFVKVDTRFARAWKLLDEGKHVEAAAAAKALVNPQQSTYLGAAKYYLYGEALAKCGKGEEAVDAYSEIFDRMRDRTSLAAEAMLRAAQTWEQLGRGMYAYRGYVLYYNKYRMVLPADERQALERKIDELKKEYGNPIESAARKMGEVSQRLEKLDSGVDTRKTQDQIVALLDDMIKTAEDAQNQSSSSSGGSKPKPNAGKSGQEGEGQGPGQGVATKPPGPNPSNPAEASSLRLGATVRPTGTSGEIRSDESGDWAKLPPRERQKLEMIRSKALSERYQEIISDYHKRLARTLSE